MGQEVDKLEIFSHIEPLKQFLFFTCTDEKNY